MAKKQKTIVIQTRPAGPDGIQLVLPELEEVFKAHDAYYTKHLIDQGPILFDKTVVLVNWFDQYAEDVFQGKIYSLQHLVGMLFDERELKSDAEIADSFRYQMYAEREYLHEFVDILKVGHLDCFKNAFWDTFVYVEHIVWGVEFYIWKSPVAKTIPRYGSSGVLRVSDIHSSLRSLFYIESLQNINDIYFRDLKPNVVFQIRQLLEKMGKNLIGYSRIVDKQGNLVKKHTQVAWKFIDQKNRTKNTAWKIYFPIDQSVILKVNNWANQFVHDSLIYSNYMQMLAIRVVNELLKAPARPITTYDGNNHTWNSEFGDIKIENYEVMKADFEHFLEEQDRQNTLIVQWLPLGKVGAYILSLGTVVPPKEACIIKRWINKYFTAIRQYLKN